MPSFSNTKVSSPAFLPFWSQSLDTPMNINKQNKMNDKQMKHILKFWQCLFVYPFWSTLHSESPVLSPRKHIVRLLHGQRWFHKKRSSGIHFDLEDCPETSAQSLITFAFVTIIISLHNLVLHWEADEKPQIGRRKRIPWNLITRREIRCQL